MQVIEDIVEDFSPKVLSNGQVRMQCPFRENHVGAEAFAKGDGTKSFFLDTEKNMYHCFSCKAKGKVTHLLRTRFDVPLFKAVELVNILGVEIQKKQEYELDFIWDILPPKMFTKRGLSVETLKNFRIGLDGDGNTVIPCFDYENNLKGVKFRNGRDFWYSENFDKRIYLYNYNPNLPWAIIVEGETDVYRLVDWGYNVIGLMTSNITDEQAKMLSKIPLLYCALDADAAGIKGMHNIYDKLKHKTDLMFIDYPADDPCACSRRAFARAFKRPCNYGEFSMKTLGVI